MTITYDSVDRRDRTTEVVVSSDLVAGAGQVLKFYWYVDGRYVGESHANEDGSTSARRAFPLFGSKANQVTIDVVDSVDAAFDPVANRPDGYPVTRLVTWRRSLDPDVETYEVSIDDGGGSVVVGVVDHAPRQWWYQWRSPVLDDLTSYTFTVTARGRNRNLGTAAQVAELIVRVPQPPDFSLAWDDGTQRVTFTEIT